MNIVDRVIGFFDPQAAFERQQYRDALQIRSNFDAAKRGKRTSGWNSSSAGPNATYNGVLAIMRNRSRDLSRNNPWGRKAVEVIETNTIGTGIRPNFGTGSRANIKTAWKDWAESTECDWDGQMDFYGIQGLVMRTVAEAGECLIRKRVDPKSKYPIKLQVLEPDFLDHNRDGSRVVGGGSIIYGVQFDKQGRRTGYWLYESHPNENGFTAAQSNFVPSDEVIHVFRVERPGQVRGIPLGISAFLRLKDLDSYEDAQLVRQRLAACFSVAITKNSEVIPGSEGGTRDFDELRPGAILEMMRGEDIELISPPGADGYGEYTKKVLQGIAAGYLITYEALTGDLSNVNFSSGRMGWLEFHRVVTKHQYFMVIPQLCSKAFDWFMDSARLAGQIPPTAKKPLVTWTPPRREMIDPVKETKAITDGILAGLIPWQEAVREQGYDPADVLAMLAEDQAAFDKLGIVLSSDARYALNNLAGNTGNDGTNNNDSGNKTAT